MENDSPVIIYTDGSAWPNPNGQGGWAFVARWGNRQRTRHGHHTGTTNNEMELMAIRQALRFIRPSHRFLHVITDSKYAMRCINEWVHLWRQPGVDWVSSTGKPVSNRELIDEIRILLDHHRKYNRGETHIQWVKGHAGQRFNELADSLAGIARIDRATDWTPEDDKLPKQL